MQEWELDKLFAIAFANQTVRRWVGMMCLVDTEPCQSINKHMPGQRKPVELPDNELGEVENLEKYCMEVLCSMRTAVKVAYSCDYATRFATSISEWQWS